MHYNETPILMKKLFLIIATLSSLSLHSMNKNTITPLDQGNILCEVVCKKQADWLDYHTICALMRTNKAINQALTTYQVDRRLELLTDALQQSFSKKNLYWCPIQFAHHPLGTALGWVDEICTTCLINGPCSCRNGWGEKETYPGILCRAQFNKDQEIEVYKALVASSDYHTQEIIKIHEEQSRYPALFPKSTQVQIHIPNHSGGQCYPHPYFYTQGNLCLLEGFGSWEFYPQNHDDNNASYFSYAVNGARECSLSGSNTYTSRKAYCRLNNQHYPLGLLYLFPLFFSKIIADQKMGPNYHNAVFKISKKILPLDTQKILSHMFLAIQESVDPTKQRNDVLDTKNLIRTAPLNQEAYFQSSIFLKAALYAKNGGNKSLACSYLKAYDNHLATESKQEFYWPGWGWNRLIVRPLGIIGTSSNMHNFRKTDYHAILKKLTTEESIDILHEKIQNNSTSVFKITDESFVEVQQRIDYAKIYLWKYAYEYSSKTIGWKCSNKHKVVNMTGTVTNAYTYMDDTIEVTDEDEFSGYKNKIRIAKNTQLTDASRPVSLIQQLVQTLLLARPLVWFRAFRQSDSLWGSIYDVKSRLTAFFYRT
jgi:hypothetical protein